MSDETADITPQAVAAEPERKSSSAGNWPPALLESLLTGWAPRDRTLPPPDAGAPYRARRRSALAERFPGEWLVVPTGGLKVRANDTHYRFRPGSDFAWLVGSTQPDAVLLVDPDGAAMLYAAPVRDRSTSAFVTDGVHGEFWVGPRPSPEFEGARLGIEVRPLAELDKVLEDASPVRVLRGFDARVERLVETDEDKDGDLAAALAELRLVKDEHEVHQLEEAVAATVQGFEDCVRQLDRAKATSERWIEGVFGLRARVAGNDVGYGSICAAGTHACFLHWTDNDGEVRDGDLVLLDMGVENRELYTADVTRTLPVNGTFTPRQREVYDLVHRAQEAGIEACRAGNDFREPHRAAMRVIASGLVEMGILTDAEEALADDNQHYRRYTLHGVSHMLGIDVHDCAHARDEVHRDGLLEVGHCLTVEPGLYFQPDDLTVPEDLRGIGVRIEDDILVTSDGPRNLSAALPRSSAEVEAWMASLLTDGPAPAS